MAAPIEKIVSPLGKLVFENSSFCHEKSKHRQFVEDHHFNYSISCILPNCSKIPEIIQTKCLNEKTFLIEQVPLKELISTDLIGAFIKRGKLHMLSHNTRIDEEDCIAILPTGHLILHLSKDTYQQLGIEGTPSLFPKRKKFKYVVDLDLFSPKFVPGRKFYNRVQWCLKDRLNLKFDFLVTWTPTDDAVCASSIQKYFLMKGYKCKPVKVKHSIKKCPEISVPDIDPNQLNFDHMEYDYNDVYEWLGGFSNGIDLTCKPDDYLSSYSFCGPTLEPSTCSYIQHYGLFTGDTVQCIIDSLREQIKELKSPWCSVTVQGFMDTPLSWKHREHGFMNNGDNLYTFIIFADDSYWLYTSYGSHDLVS